MKKKKYINIDICYPKVAKKVIHLRKYHHFCYFIKLSNYGLTLEVVLIIGGIFVGDNLGVRLDNAITVDVTDNIVSIFEAEIEQKCSRGTTLYGNNFYVMKSDDTPMYFYCATCARLWSEKNYSDFLDGNFWNGLLYERWNGYENTLKNQKKLRQVLKLCNK